MYFYAGMSGFRSPTAHCRSSCSGVSLTAIIHRKPHLYKDNFPAAFAKLLFTPFTVTFANPFKIRFANGICSHLNHVLTPQTHRTSFASQQVFEACVNCNNLLCHSTHSQIAFTDRLFFLCDHTVPVRFIRSHLLKVRRITHYLQLSVPHGLQLFQQARSFYWKIMLFKMFFLKYFPVLFKQIEQMECHRTHLRCNPTLGRKLIRVSPSNTGLYR